MYDHALFYAYKSPDPDIRPHITWAVSLEIGGTSSSNRFMWVCMVYHAIHLDSWVCVVY